MIMMGVGVVECVKFQKQGCPIWPQFIFSGSSLCYSLPLSPSFVLSLTSHLLLPPLNTAPVPSPSVRQYISTESLSHGTHGEFLHNFLNLLQSTFIPRLTVHSHPSIYLVEFTMPEMKRPKHQAFLTNLPVCITVSRLRDVLNALCQPYDTTIGYVNLVTSRPGNPFAFVTVSSERDLCIVVAVAHALVIDDCIVNCQIATPAPLPSSTASNGEVPCANPYAQPLSHGYADSDKDVLVTYASNTDRNDECVDASISSSSTASTIWTVVTRDGIDSFNVQWAKKIRGQKWATMTLGVHLGITIES